MANKSDCQSKSCKEATKAFFSSVSGRTRSKRDSYLLNEARRDSCSSGNTGNASAPNRKKCVGDSSLSSSFNNNGLARLSTSQGQMCKRKRKPKKPAATARVVRPRKTLGNGSDDSDSEGIEIIDEDSFRSHVACQNSCSTPKIGSSGKENVNASFSAATPMKDASFECRGEPSAGYCESFCPEDGSDRAWRHESRSFDQSEKCSDDKKSEEIEVQEIDEAVFRNQKSHFESKRGQSAEQVFCSSYSNKKVDGAKNSTLAREVSNGEDTDSDESGIEKIDEAEFKKRMKQLFTEREKVDESDSRQFITKAGPSTWQDSNEEHFAATAAENAKRVSRKNVHEVDSSSSSEFIDSSSSEFDSHDEVSISLQDVDVSSCGAEHETGPSIASRTRSKMGGLKKPAEVGNVSSLDSDSSSPTDSGYHSYNDEVETSDGGVEFLGSNLKACELEKYKSMKVSAGTEGCSIEKGGALEQSEGSNYEQPENMANHEEAASEFQKSFMGFNPKVREVQNYRSMKVSAEAQDCNKEEVGAVGQSEESNSGQPECRHNREEAKHALDCSKDKGSVAEHALDRSNSKFSSRKRRLGHGTSRKIAKEGKATKRSKAAEDQEKSEAMSSDLHLHDQTESLCMPADMNVSVGRKQVTLERKDICSMLADAVLGRVQFPEKKEHTEEAEQVPASKIQNALPLKFRFEDEVQEVREKTEYEVEIEEQFSLLESCFLLEELNSSGYPEVGLGKGNSPAEETQYERCCRGKHDLVIEDEEGLICICCRHVELGPKDVLPEWVERACRESGKKRLPEMEQLLEFDELHLQSSIDDVVDLKNGSGTVWSIKPGVRETMYEHQQEGFEFLWKNLAGSINLDELKSSDVGEVGGCIISHAPGTGKTRLTIVFLETYLKLYPNCYPMIIGPASMLLTWEEEFRKWKFEFPFLNLSSIELSAKEKHDAGHLAQAKSRDKEYIRMIKIYSWSKGRRILGISYSLFEKLTGVKQNENMRKILLEKPGLAVLDEGHTPRNRRSGIWKSLLKLKTGKRIILSGTPFQNNFAELFNTLRLVRPAVADVISQEKTFDAMVAARSFSSRRRNRRDHFQSCLSEVDDRAVEKLKSCMSPFVHVHKGTILQKSLPGLRDCVILLKPPALQKSLIERIEGTNTFKYEHDVALVSVHPYLFRHCDATEGQMDGIDMGAVEASKLNHQEGVKTRFVVELVHLSMAVEEKVLIFSQFIQPLQLIKEQLKEVFKWAEGREILQMQGNVDLKQRQVLINQFNDPQSESKIMLASTKCCSEGISLIGASRVVLVDVVWNPSVERQAICRAYRIGQKKFVYTYHLMTCGTTEADKYCRQAEKERMSELVFSSANESDQQKHPSVGIEDRILEVMVGHIKLKEMFDKIINQPKDTDLIQTFGL